MAAPTHHWKVGLFVVVGLVLALGAVVVFGAKSLQTSSTRYWTYFDESVQGLEVGSPVKFRGVTVGEVAGIAIAPDKRHVEVTSDIDDSKLGDLGLAQGPSDKVLSPVRVQLASQGITGVKFLQIDLFEGKQKRLPELPFPVPAHYLPSQASTLKSVEAALVHAVERVPEMTSAVVKTNNQIGRIIDSVERQDLPGRAASTLSRVETLAGAMQNEIKAANLAELSSHAERSLTGLDATIAKANAAIARLEGDRGLLASLQRSSDAAGELLSAELTGEMVETLRSIRQASEALTRLADALERDPDMLLKGRKDRR